MLPTRIRGWSGPPLALQILGLLIGALVVAQLVTLFLTLLLPPAPPARYELGDIARGLRGATVDGGLERHLQPGPPDVSGRGWLVSDISRRELAAMLHVRPEDVTLAFYTELPFGGTAAPLAPPPPAAPADARPVAVRSHPAVRRAAAHARPIFGLATVVPIAAAIAADAGPARQSAPGGPPTGGGRPGSFPGTGFPGGSFPGGGFPSTGLPRGIESRSPQGRQPFPGQRGEQAGQGHGEGDRPGSGGGGTGRPDPTGQPLGNGRQGPTGGQRGFPGRPLAQPQRGPLLDAPILIPTERWSLPSTLPSPAPTAIPTSTPVPRAVREAPSLPDYVAPPALSGASSVAPPTVVPPRVVVAPPATHVPRPIAIPLRPVARGLFGLAPAPFIEGDFVAALRRPDGRYVLLAPKAEGFPNAWQQRVLLWFVLSLALVAPIAWLFARRIVRPLRGFADAAEALGRDPSAAILPLSGPAEVGRAAHAFNLMQNRLRAFVDDRTAMVGAISHDLRTPLTRMRFRIEDVPEGQQDGMLEEVAEMEAMITSVLEFIRDASTPGVRERLDLSELVGTVVRDAKMVGGDVIVESTISAQVDVDAIGMRRLLDNLLENAVKYGVRARVQLSTEGGEAIARIVDDGPGIPEDEIERAFEPFYRSASARASEKSGSGLGLAVCRSIARAHGGDVRLLHSAEGFIAQVNVPLAYDGFAAAA